MTRVIACLCGSALLLGTMLAAAEAAPVCWSDRSCQAKILSNRDKHNCKVKSHGKGWQSAPGATCQSI